MKSDTKAQIADTIDKLQDIVDEAADDAERVSRVARREIRNHPGASVTIALGVGLVAGTLIGSLSRPS